MLVKVKVTFTPFKLKSIILSATIFSLTVGFICLNVFIYQLQKPTIEFPLTHSQQVRIRIVSHENSNKSDGLVTNNRPSLVISFNKTEERTPTDCTMPGHFNDFHFNPSTKYRESKTLPQWMKDYFDWHRQQTLTINKCNYNNHRFLAIRCSNKEKRCGGVSDRLKSLPFFIAAAAHHKRILLIRWERPTKLEEFLLPNLINWAAPEYLPFHNSTFIVTGNKIVNGLERYEDVLIIEGFLQDFFGGSAMYYKYDTTLDDKKTFNETHVKKHRDKTGWFEYEEIFRDLFFAFFTPSPPVAKLVREKMESQNLVPGNYSASQYRAFYGIEHKKNKRDNPSLIRKATNALNCASQKQPGDPIFFASDSKVAVVTARKMDEDYTDRHIVTFDDEQEALHLDKKDQWKSGNVSDFYPTFVDLLIMAEAKCMSLGVGGFGRFANILSKDPECAISHDHTRAKRIQYCEWHDKVVASAKKKRRRKRGKQVHSTADRTSENA